MDKRSTENPFNIILRETATKKWGKSLMEEVLPALEQIADAILEIENHQLMLEVEPAFTTSILQLTKKGE